MGAFHLSIKVGECQTQFAVKPRAGRAVLFYSQNPDGSKDGLSLHGACPVLIGDKWAGIQRKPTEKECGTLRHSGKFIPDFLLDEDEMIEAIVLDKKPAMAASQLVHGSEGMRACLNNVVTLLLKRPTRRIGTILGSRKEPSFFGMTLIMPFFTVSSESHALKYIVAAGSVHATPV
eukprot:scaffold1055_cov165-Amphora_coffeaeformis.AAC.11